MTLGISLCMSGAIAANVRSLCPSPGPMASARLPWSSCSSSGAASSPITRPSLTTRAVAQGAVLCSTGSTGRAHAQLTSPAPERSAAFAHRHAAPAMPSLPATTSTCPNVPLLASNGRTGSIARASASCVTS